ncbi:hypothetical protein RND71_022546 [Anisodus tanguticus]|uniref:Pre-SET domain-containing protein n=1 Tax=Anisodus tanguticus TaxID=243964 RepID=A0AAE1VAU9_9SOLA|nr:hypothetical protein RND71_022546 [Anisodus tanguticus]
MRSFVTNHPQRGVRRTQPKGVDVPLAVVPAGLPNSAYYIEDITNGQEEHRISLINEFSDHILPVFKYIPKNVIFQNAHVKFLLARISDDNCCSNCSGDCMSQDIPCACAGETGGEFAYTSGGLLKEKFLESCISMNHEPQKRGLVYCRDGPLEMSKNNSMSGLCKGHLVRKFIKECWHKCGCSKGCRNRVVQRGGIPVSLQVRKVLQTKSFMYDHFGSFST